MSNLLNHGRWGPEQSGGAFLIVKVLPTEGLWCHLLVEEQFGEIEF